MKETDAIRFHSERAEAERARASDAASPVAARAHRQLAELHAERARALYERVPESPPGDRIGRI